MYACVAYDISSNRLRLKVVKWCKKIGLLRIQKSVFAGPVAAGDLADLDRGIRPLLAPSDKFMIVPFDKPTYRVLLEQSANERLKALQEVFVVYDF